MIVFAVSLGLALPALGDDCYTFVKRWGQTGDGALRQPIDVAVDADGYAYVTEGVDGGHSVKKFRAESGQFVWQRDMAPVPMRYPQSVAVDAFGYVYVTDGLNGRLCVFRKDNGDPVGWFGGCADPSHVGIGSWHRRDSNHTPQTGQAPGQFASMYAVDVDSSGRVYANDYATHRVQVLELTVAGSDGMSLIYAGWFGGCDEIGAHSGNDRMHAPGSTHHPVSGDGNGFFFQGPAQIATTHDNLIYVEDAGGEHLLQLFTTSGAFVRDWDRSVFSPISSDWLWGLDIDGEGNVYISDAIYCWVRKYTPDMSLVCSWGSRGTDDGQFLWAHLLDLDNSGRVYVTDAHMSPPCVHVFAPSNRPPVAMCQNVRKSANEDCQATAMPEEVNGGSYDPEGGMLTLTLTPSGPYALGETAVILTVTDPKGASSQCTAKITVIDETPPALTCPSDIAVGADPGQCGAIVGYESPHAVDKCDGEVQVTCDPPSGSTFPVGQTTVVCTAKDNAGNQATCSFTITVEDRESPVIGVISAPIVLWPPNHKYTTVKVADLVTIVSDNCAALTADNVVIARVTSDEPEDATGDGDGSTLEDIVIASDCRSAALRQERQGSGNGRVCTIHLSIYDGAGNEGTAVVQVQVPHDRKDVAVDDGPTYEVTGCGAE